MNIGKMNKKNSRLELLPNEILLLIFQYFNAQDLFQAFYKLNYRFNHLIQCFNDLQLVYQMKNFDYNDKNIFFNYVYTLVIDDDTNINFRYFPNIRRLKLNSISKNIISQLNSFSPPYLECLTLDRPGMFSKKIKNRNLLYLNQIDILKSTNRCMSLNILKLGCINSLNYTSILSLCPNLKYFDISITAYYKSLSNMIFHTHLQQMTIRIRDIIHDSIDDIMDNYLLCVPNLKYLSIHLGIFDLKAIEFYLNYNWFKKAIEQCLPSLQQCQFYIYINEFDISQIKDIEYQMKKNFQIIHNNQYKYQLLFIH